jgi:KipI family sensor histidine kinase inhibitor
VIASRFGERATYVDLGLATAPDRAARTHAVARAILAAFPDADVVVGGACVAAHGARDVDAVAAAARAAMDGPPIATPTRREHTVHVVYDGPDLAEVAAEVGLTLDAVARVHAEAEYVVEIVGFLPGFAYLAGLDRRLVVPRRSAPRPRVPAGSVGVAGDFTGVYPFASPGGWRLVGRALESAPFDPTADATTRFAPGDGVRFVAVERGEREVSAPPRREPVDPSRPALVVEAAPPGTTVQDGGRAGLLARGVPASGPLDPEALAAANLGAGNAPELAAIEIPLGAATLVARRAVVVAIDDEPPRRLGDGERLEVPAVERAVRYVAVRGGVDVPPALGARATLLVAALGGHEGRSLRRGDVLPVGAGGEGRGRRPDLGHDSTSTTLDIDVGPHVGRFPAGALEALCAGEFRVSRLGDRVGVRLEGARVPRDGADLGLPAPMLRGAIQIATDGTPIVLGPDHPATGGYPVLATVRRASLGRLARLRPGSAVALRLA